MSDGGGVGGGMSGNLSGSWLEGESAEILRNLWNEGHLLEDVAVTRDLVAKLHDLHDDAQEQLAAHGVVLQGRGGHGRGQGEGQEEGHMQRREYEHQGQGRGRGEGEAEMQEQRQRGWAGVCSMVCCGFGPLSIAFVVLIVSWLWVLLGPDVMHAIAHNYLPAHPS